MVEAQIPMSDGSTYDFAGVWSPISERMEFGNNGPAGGQPRHFTDRCLTLNRDAHQKFRFAQMTGTLNGEAVRSYNFTPWAATIFNNSFKYIEVHHGGATCP